MRATKWALLLGVGASSLALARRSAAIEIPVTPGTSIQTILDAAAPGDIVLVAPGTWIEDLDFRGKAVTVRGSGPASILRGTGTTSVVRFASGEGPGSVLDSLTITGGVADEGGGIYVARSSPTIVRNVIVDNAAVREGSGIRLADSESLVANNLILRNHSAGGDPHGIQISDGAPQIVNNTITLGDSNGILVRRSAASIRNNIIFANGTRRPGDARGRGICDFSGNQAAIHYNLFSRNVVAALLGGGRDWRYVEAAERTLALPTLIGNRDGSPGFVHPRRGNFTLRATSRARHAGDPDPVWRNRDGTRNTIGHTGGPLAP